MDNIENLKQLQEYVLRIKTTIGIPENLELLLGFPLNSFEKAQIDLCGEVFTTEKFNYNTITGIKVTIFKL